MLARLSILLLVAIAAWPQAPQPKKDPPTPRERAREILDKAIDTAVGAQPEVQVAGLLHLSDLYWEFDKTRSEELFRQAFTAAGALPDQNKRGQLMVEVARSAAEHNTEMAIEFLQQLGPPQSGRRDDRVPILVSVVQQLVKQKQNSRAAQLITSLGSEGEFGYSATTALLRATPEGDPLRVELFSAALAAYSVRPVGPFADFVSRNWRSVPPQLAESAVNALINAHSDRKKNETDSFSQTLSTSKGVVSFSSPENAELFDVMHIIRAVNAKRADELLESRVELRDAVTRFPEGKQSMYASANDTSMSTSTDSGSKGRSSGPSAEMQLRAIASSKSQQASAALKESPEKALSLIREIPIESQRARLLATVANSVADKDPATAKAVLTECSAMLDQMKDPKNSVDVYIDVAETAHKIKDDERARLAIDKALTGAAALYKDDSNAESPNEALREYWPSTQSYRRIIHRATAMFGPETEFILPRIADPDLQLLASIEMARSLLKKPPKSGAVSVNRSGKR